MEMTSSSRARSTRPLHDMQRALTNVCFPPLQETASGRQCSRSRRAVVEVLGITCGGPGTAPLATELSDGQFAQRLTNIRIN